MSASQLAEKMSVEELLQLALTKYRAEKASSAAMAAELNALKAQLQQHKTDHPSSEEELIRELDNDPEENTADYPEGPTGRLLRLCRVTEKNADFTPDIAAIQRCVAEGAEVMYVGPGSVDCPLLTRFIFSGQVDVVRVCLGTPAPINFSLGNIDGWTPLHVISIRSDKAPEVVGRLLNDIIDRLDRRVPGDVYDWGKRNKHGNDAISWAAHNGHLSTWWRTLVARGVTFYTQHAGGPITLTQKVERHDWEERMTEEERSHFNPLWGLYDPLQ